MSSTLGVRHQQTRWFPPPMGRLGVAPVAVEASAGVIQGAEDRLEVSKMASRENGRDFGVAFVGDVEEEEEEEEDEEEGGSGEEEGGGIVRRTFRFVLPESPSAEGEEGGEEDDGDEEEEDDAAGEGCWSGDRRIPRVGRASSSSFVSGEDDGARRPEEEGERGGNGTPHPNRRPRRPCSVVLDPIPGDLLRSLSSVGRISAERASVRSTPPPLADCDEPPRPLPPLHPQQRARPIAVVDPSCEGPRRRLSAPAVAGGPPAPPGEAAPLLAGAPLRHRRCSCHGAGAHGARSPRQAIDPPTLPPRRHGGAWASRDVMTTSDPDVEVLAVAEEEARGGGRECRENGVREERRRNIEEEGERTVRKRERAKRRRRREEEEDDEEDEEEGEEEEEEEGGRSSGEAEREIRSVERNNYRKRSCSSSTTASSSTASSTSTAFSLRRRHKHRKRRRRRARPLESEEEETVPSTAEVVEEVPNPNPTPRVNPIFVWAKQDDAATILEVLCEDYDKRNRIRLTKTPNGWRAIPRTERLAAATAISSVSQPPKDAATDESATASNTEGPPDPSVLLRLPLATTVPPPPRRRSRGSQAKDKPKGKESHKGGKLVPREVDSPDENKPHEDHVDSPGQPETYGGEGPGRPEKSEEKISEASSVIEAEKSPAPKPKTIKPRDQRLGNKRVRKAPVKRAKPRRKPPVKKIPSAPVTPISPSQEVKSPKDNKDVVAQECVETFPRREPIAKVVTRSRRKNARVTRVTTRSRARTTNSSRKVKSSNLPPIVSPPSPAPQSPSVVQEVVEEEEMVKEVEEIEKEVEEEEKVEELESTEIAEAGEASVDKGMSSRDYESEEEVPIEERGVGEEATEEAPTADEGEEGAPITEEAVGDEEAEVVGSEETEEVLEEVGGEEESGAARVNSEEEGAQEEEEGDLESHVEAQVEDIEEVDAIAENEEVNENEITNEETPESEDASEGAEAGVVEGEIEGELVEEGANVEEVTNEEDVDIGVQREEEEEEAPAEVEMEEGELPALEEEVVQVEEGEAEDETAVEEEEEAAEEEEGEEEEEDEDEEEEDDEEEEEEEEEGPPKTPPPAHAASIPTLLVSQPNIVDGVQEEPADLSTQKRRGDEVDEPPPFKKVRRGHVTALPPSTRITTCPRSMLPPKELRMTNVDPSVPAPAHSLEPIQPAPSASTEERPTESKTPQKDPLDLVFPGYEDPVKSHESADAKEQWRKVSSSATSVRENPESKADTGNGWEENISMEPPIKKIKVEVEEEEEAVSDSIEPNVPIEDSHQITLKKLLSCPKEASPNPGLATSVDIVVPKPKVEIVFPSEVADGVGKSCARSRLLELLTSPDAHKSPPPNRSTPSQRTPSPANPIVITRPYSQPPPAVKLEPRSEDADSNCVDGKAGLELKRLKDLLGKQSAAKLALKPMVLENQAPLVLKQTVSPSEASASRMPTPEAQQPASLSIQRNPPVTTRGEPVRVPQTAVRSHKQTKSSHQSSIPHSQNSVRRSSGRDMNASSRVDNTSGAEQDAAAAAAAAALHNMLWLPYLGQLEMAVNTGNRELLASLGNAMFGPPPAVSPSSQSATSPRALSHFPTPPPPQNPPFVHGTPFLHPSSLPPSAIADYKSRVELSQTLNLWQDIMAANASTAFNSAHQDMLAQESLERNGGANGIIGSHRQDGNISTHLQERQSPRFPSNSRKPSPISTPLSPSHSPSADFLRYINSGVFPGGAVANPRPQPSPQNNNHFGIRYNGVHNSNAVQHASKHSLHEQKAPIRHPTPSQIYRNIESSSNQLQHTLSLASVSRPRKSPTVSMAGNSDSSQNKNSMRRQPSSSPRDEVGKIPVSSSMATATSRQKPTLTCRSLLNLLSNPRPDGTESIPSEMIPDDSTSGGRLDQHRHGHLLAALARPSSNQQEKRAIDMSRLPPIPSSLRPQVIGLDPESEYLQSARFSNPLSGVPHTLLPTGVQPMDLSGRSGGKSSKREERVAAMEVFRGQEMAATLNTASGSTHPHLWHPLFGRRPVTHGDGEQLLSMGTDLEVGKQCYYLDDDQGLLDGDSDVSTTDKPLTLTSLTMTAHLWSAYSPTPDTLCYRPGSVPATDPQV